MDNLPAPKATEVRAAIESVGARVVFLSPYSPDFNPIKKWRTRVAKTLRHRELSVWSKLKQYLRSVESRTYEELARAITEAIELGIRQRYHWLVYSLLLLCSIQLKTAISS